MKYVDFREMKVPKGRKTKIYAVYGHDEYYLGEIRWYSGWRKYVFDCMRAIHSEKCLRDIADFIKDLMEERKREGVSKQK